MPEQVGRVMIQARRDHYDPKILGWLNIDERNPSTNFARGHLFFRNAEEVQAAIRELTTLLPAVDQLGHVLDE